MHRQPLIISHQQTNAQLVSEHQLLWKDSSPAVLLLSMVLHDMEYILSKLGSAVLPVIPPKLLSTPSLLPGVAVRNRESLGAAQGLFSNS